MRRRDVIALFGGAVLAARVAEAQQAAKPARIGVIGSDRRNPVGTYQGLLAGLRELGLIEGENLTVQFVSVTEQSPAALFAAAAELVRSKPDLLVVLGPELGLQAAVAATRSLPIVIIATNYDPIALGYVKGLAQPGGNITGLFNRQPELAEKQVELLTQAFPERTRLALLYDAFSTDQFTAAEHRARSLRLEPLSLKLENPPYDFEATFSTLAQSSPQMLVVLSSPHFTLYRDQIAELALRHRLPSMFIFKAYVEAGGLMSYGYDGFKASRRAAGYIAKILAGTKPGDLPIEQPTTFELVINLKTAGALGITVPRELLARADEVIE
jgi:putative tryptophan/tyrosine transport system substrate-binding protein